MAIIIYLIYLLSGIIKTVFVFYGIKFSIDITLLSGVLLLIYLGYDLYVNGVKLRYQKDVLVSIILLTGFLMWIIISVFHSLSTGYAYRKTFLFLTNLIAFLFPLIIKQFDLSKFLRLFSVSVILAFVWFYYRYFNFIGKLDKSEIYYQIMGLSLTIAIYGGIILLTLLTSKTRIFKNLFYNFTVIIFLSGFLLLSGARGPIFFAVFSLTLFYLVKLPKVNFFKRIRINKIIKISFFISTLIISVFLVVYKYYDKISVLTERSLYRISLILNGIRSGSNMGDSVNVRVNQIEFAVNSISENVQNFLIGYGFGSFGIMYSGVDGRLYPHNVLLEIWFELGFIGLIIFSAFLFSIFFDRIKKRIFISGFVMLYIFLNMLKSNSIVDIRVFFAFFAFFIINSNIRKEIVDNEN